MGYGNDWLAGERHKMNRKKSLLLAVVLLTADLIFHACGLSDKQYNSNGLSNIMTVLMDETQEKEYVGELDGHRIFIEGLKIGSLEFTRTNGEKVSLKDAIENELTSIDDWRKGAWKIRKEGDAEILQYENYEIAIAYDDCIIRPISR